MSEIPKGFCQCGCGGLAPIAKETCTRKGHRKGEPMKFIWGHNQRGRENKGVASRKGPLNHAWKGGNWEDSTREGQRFIYCPDHPRAHKNMVSEHVLIVERALGKYLPPKAIVHHHTLKQLVACENQAFHLFIHQRKRAFEASGHANWRKCVFCKKYDDPVKLTFPKKGMPYHRECVNERNRKYLQRRKERENQVTGNL